MQGRQKRDRQTERKKTEKDRKRRRRRRNAIFICYRKKKMHYAYGPIFFILSSNFYVLCLYLWQLAAYVLFKFVN
jgi:hypothetical protein